MKLNKHDKHDDFCPCTRFRAQGEFCTCGAIERAEIVEGVSKEFADRLREISGMPSPELRQSRRYAPITDEQIREIMACDDVSTARIKLARLIDNETRAPSPSQRAMGSSDQFME